MVIAGMRIPCTMDKQGRVQIPAEIREALNLKYGDRFLASIERGRIILSFPEKEEGGEIG